LLFGTGNPCPDAEKPFPCKSTPTCIPMGYLCDDSVDCEDGYDEDPEVCTAGSNAFKNIMETIE